jgi:predicted  nucleic acid-binding Zn-ribbon protein
VNTDGFMGNRDLPDDFEEEMKKLLDDFQKLVEEILNLIGGITPRQIEALRELEEAEKTIRSYLEDVEGRLRQIKEAMGRVEEKKKSP